MAGARSLAETYRRFGEGAAGTLQGRVASTLSTSEEALRALETAPARTRRPAVVLAALHDLALAGRAPDLAAAHAAADAAAAARAAVDVLVRTADAVAAVAARRRPLADEAGRWIVLYPAVAEAARRVGADAVGLVDVGRPAGLNLLLDRVGLAYGGERPVLGDPASPVQRSAVVVGDRPVPEQAAPAVVARVLLDPDPVDVTNPDDARWLRACLPPDQPDRLAALVSEVALAASDPPLLLPGAAADVLPGALARVPSDALPVVTTTWSLSRLSPVDRARFGQRLGTAAVGRAVAWVSVEGVGVAPGIPTLGDRPASGHSLIGLALFDGARRSADVLGRCWSRGRLLSWAP